MIKLLTLLVVCALSSSALANLNGYLASSGASKESLEQVDYSTFGAYLHFDKLPKVLFLVDSIEDGDVFDFRRALRKHPSISAVVLDSEGGLVSEALLIAGVVSDRDMTTYVPKDALCASACSFIYFAGKSRLVKGKLGVHQFANADKTKSDNVNEVQQNTQYTTSEIISFLNAFDTPSFVYEEMFASSKMYYFTKEEQIKLSSHESLAILTSVDTFIGSLKQEAELQEKQQRIGTIKTLQTELKRLGCYDGLVDGVVGSSTEKALGRYLERAAQTSDWGADSLVKLTKKLTKEKRVECVKEKAVSTPKVVTPKVVTPKISDPKIISDEEAVKKAYLAAFNLIRERQYDEAIIAMRAFIKDFPQGALLGNAHYWLGELYMVQGDASLAVLSFEHVIDDFPTHRKIPDALYKIGVAYQALRNVNKAKAMLQRVISGYPNSAAAKLAKERIDTF
jgi:tol-pal system protein YbgF